jgi:biopolymer transport protein ExbD
MRFPLMGRTGIALIVVGSALLIYTRYWVVPRLGVALNIPISLSPGRVRTGNFRVDPDRFYEIEIETDRTSQSTPAGCDPDSVIRIDWTLYSEGRFADHTSHRPLGHSLGDFISENSQYALDAEVLPGASCLNAFNPRLVVHTDSQLSDLCTVLTWFLVWCIASGFFVLLSAVFQALFKQKAAPRMFPEMALRNVLPLQRYRPMPLIKEIPNVGLFYGCILFIWMFFFIISPGTQRGLMVEVGKRNTPSWQNSPWPETLSVYVDRHGEFYVNGRRVRKEELGAKLNEELSKRVVWTVYFEADDNVAFTYATYSIDTIQGLGANLVWITPKMRQEWNAQAARATR